MLIRRKWRVAGEQDSSRSWWLRSRTLTYTDSVRPIDQKRCNRERWGDKARKEDKALEAEKESDFIGQWIVKGKKESPDRYAVVARSREIQTDSGPSNGPSS